MTIAPFPLDPTAGPLPSYPPSVYQGCLYHLAHPASISTHVRCFSYSFRGLPLDTPFPYRSFGDWTLSIGYSLYLLAEDLEENYRTTPDRSEQSDLINILRELSGHWTFLEGRLIDDLAELFHLCDDALVVLEDVLERFPMYPGVPLRPEDGS